MSQTMQTAADAANNLEALPQIERAVSTWGDCDIAALVQKGEDIGPVTDLGNVVEINDFDAAPYVLVKVDQR